MEKETMDKINQEKLEIIEILIKQRESIQKLREASNTKNIREYDDSFNTPRQIVYQDRRKLRFEMNENLKNDTLKNVLIMDKSDASIKNKPISNLYNLLDSKYITKPN